MSPAIRSLEVNGVWVRLQRAESETLAGLLDLAEREAVHRRLGLASRQAADWVPQAAGEYGGRFQAPHGPGALYLGSDLATCIAEILHHHARICAASQGTPPGSQAVLRQLSFQVAGKLADAAGARGQRLHDPNDYAPSWAFARQVRTAGLAGVHYRSVRHPGGRCLAVFENRALSFLRSEFGAVVVAWDGSRSHRTA